MEKKENSRSQDRSEPVIEKEPYEPLEIEVIDFTYEDVISCD